MNGVESPNRIGTGPKLRPQVGFPPCPDGILEHDHVVFLVEIGFPPVSLKSVGIGTYFLIGDVIALHHFVVGP